MELWIVRHGETLANTQGIMQGHQGGELTEKGHLQATLVGNRLSSVTFTEIYVSDLNRTKQTADNIIMYHKETPVIYDKRIRERCGGMLEGKPIKNMIEIAKSKGISLRKFRPREGENWLDVYDRAQEFLHCLITKYIKDDYIYQDSKMLQFNVKESIKILSPLKDIIELKSKNSMTTLELYPNDKEIAKLDTQFNQIFIEHKKTNPDEFDINQKNQINIDDVSLPFTKSYSVSMDKPYQGYTDNQKLDRILIVTHGGFIMELLNVIRDKKGLPTFPKNNSLNTALYIIKIYCSKCGEVCLKKEGCEENKLEFDFILNNDNSHCKAL